MTEKIWKCTIGAKDVGDLPLGADLPMRKAIERAFFEITGVQADFTFSGWGAKLSDSQRAFLDHIESQRREDNING